MGGNKILNIACSEFCGSRPCEFQADVEEGRIVRLEIHPKMRFPPCGKGWVNIQRLYHPERLLYPLKRVGKRGEGKWKRISWNEALDMVGMELKATKAKYGNEALAVYVAGGRWMEYPMGPRLLAARLFNLFGGYQDVRHEAVAHLAGANSSATRYLFGSGEVALPGDSECKFIMIWGKDPSESIMRSQMSSYLDAREKGTRFVVINPVLTRLAAVLADEYIPINPGTDGALAWAMMNILIQEKLYEEKMLTDYTNAPFLIKKDDGCILREHHVNAGGTSEPLVWDPLTNRPQVLNNLKTSPALSADYAWNAIKMKTVWQLISDRAQDWPPDKAAKVTGVPVETMVKLARDFWFFKPSKIPAIGGGSLGFISGAENACYAIQLLNVISGNIRGVFPPASSFGIGLVEEARKLVGKNPVTINFPTNHLAEAILNPEKYGTNIRLLFCLASNPVSQHADSNKNIRALLKLDFLVVCDLFMTATAKYADLLLPACMPWEKSFIVEASEVGKLTNYCPLLHLKPKKQLFYSQKAVAPMGQSKDDLEIIFELAREMGYGEYFPWHNAEEYMEYLLESAKQNPSFPWLKSMTMENLREEGIVDIDSPMPAPSMAFKTPSGKMELYSETLLKQGCEPIPIYSESGEGPSSTPELYQKYPLYLVTPTTLWRVHSRFSNQPELLEYYTNDVLMHPQDASKRGIKNGDLVEVFNDRGRIELKATMEEAIKPGVVRIYVGAELEQGMANFLTSDRLTGYGQSPTFHNCLVEVRRKNEK